MTSFNRSTIFRVFGLIVALGIVIGSVLPGAVLVSFRLVNSQLEHFVGYMLLSALAGLIGPGKKTLTLTAVLLTMMAGGLELIQILVPGRIPSFLDFLASAGGAWAGTFLSAYSHLLFRAVGKLGNPVRPTREDVPSADSDL
ncbi:VanZ family protein [Microvirga sp. BT291]|nr:VanZ family protein [Microvirga pudoricolor]